MENNDKKIYTVYQLNTQIKAILDNNLPGRINVAAEISNWRNHYSGHMYFILKDESSQMPAVMWKSSVARLKFEPENGMAILATGHVDVYPPHGKYQFIVDTLKPAGIGDLQLEFEQMVKKLQAQGLFDDRHKKPIPSFPMRIGILTSESGAAIHDITDSIHSRWPCAKLFLYPIPVQGKGAHAEIAAAIRDVNRRNGSLNLDLLILGRGGGSMEDLWSFNEEDVVRAIFDSRIPLISAIGHEIDTTIADMVADARASTPTKAGMIAVPDAGEIANNLLRASKRMEALVMSRLNYEKQRLSTIRASGVFRNPYYNLQYKSQQLDELHNAIMSKFMQKSAKLWKKIDIYEIKLRSIEPHKLTAEKKILLNTLNGNLQNSIRRATSGWSTKLALCGARLGALNPKSVLKRGYSITKDARTGKILQNISNLSVGNSIITELSDEKTFESVVKEIKN